MFELNRYYLKHTIFLAYKCKRYIIYIYIKVNFTFIITSLTFTGQIEGKRKSGKQHITYPTSLCKKMLEKGLGEIAK